MAMLPESISFGRAQVSLSGQVTAQPDSLAGMSVDNSEIGKRIAEIRRNAKLSQDKFGERFGVTRAAVSNWERGQGIKRENLIAITQEFGVSFEWLATGSTLSGPAIERGGTPLTFAGFVQAGYFRAVDEYFQQDEFEVPDFVLPVPRYRKMRQYTWLARGDSMSEAGILDGMWVVGADAGDYVDQEGDIESGDLVVVERTTAQGAERELTVKEARFYRDRMELVPRSLNTEHQPIVVPHNRAPSDNTEVRIIGVVLTAYADLRRRR
jgi:transcriptional regulator with XRE-family HTH domain